MYAIRSYYVFIDEINRNNPLAPNALIESTNPCGEQPLLPMEACNLGSINLARFIQMDESGTAGVDYAALGNTVHEAVRFLRITSYNVCYTKLLRPTSERAAKPGDRSIPDVRVI